VGSGAAGALAEQPGAAMSKALRPGVLQGYAKRKSLGTVVKLSKQPSSTELSEAIEAVYRQFLGRQPLAAEQLIDAESQLRKGQLCVAEFVGRVANSDLFVSRLNRMTPLKAAAAAYMAVLGRAAQPAETSAFLASRCTNGLRSAIDVLINSSEYAGSFGRDTVPYLKGMATTDGLPLSTVNRTASLYGGNAALNPPKTGAI
jgi:phycobilisome core-membrane linker protein